LPQILHKVVNSEFCICIIIKTKSLKTNKKWVYTEKPKSEEDILQKPGKEPHSKKNIHKAIAIKRVAAATAHCKLVATITTHRYKNKNHHKKSLLI